nr:MAG TPA: hypothetical protein [Caudoviricetes sp.]
MRNAIGSSFSINLTLIISPVRIEVRFLIRR